MDDQKDNQELDFVESWDHLRITHCILPEAKKIVRLKPVKIAFLSAATAFGIMGALTSYVEKTPTITMIGISSSAACSLGGALSFLLEHKQRRKLKRLLTGEFQMSGYHYNNFKREFKTNLQLLDLERHK